MAARTAVVAGTATAVSGRVARRQAARYDEQDAQQYAQEGKDGVVDIDIAKFFDHVNHDILMGRIGKVSGTRGCCA